MTTKTLISCLLAWPLLALITHLLLPQKAKLTRQWAQIFCMIIWLGITLVLLHNHHPTVIAAGNWPGPFGITLVSDSLSSLMLTVFAIVATCISFYSHSDKPLEQNPTAFYAGFWLLLLGISGAVLTADLFNLYVWFEVMLASAFILLASSHKPKPHALLHYATLNITGTLFMLLAIALIYGALGTLNYADIAWQLRQQNAAWVTPVFCLLLFASGLKGGVFPAYFWLPKAYPKPSISATMLLSSLITKTVMVVLLRWAWLWRPLHQSFLGHSLLYLALATMLFGVLGAACQFRFKEILSFHIISQIGYILLAIALSTLSAITAAIYFLIHNIFVKTQLFMVAGTLEAHTGSDDFKKLGSALKEHKWLACAFFFAAMSLAGFPPTSGFWSKFFVIKASLIQKHYLATSIAILVSLFTLYSMIKIWRYVFCEPSTITPQTLNKPLDFSWQKILAMLTLASLPIIMGLWPDSTLQFIQPITTELSSPDQYIQLILGVVQ
jgi:multicomponent Na+:H+ antiporter subunit D